MTSETGPGGGAPRFIEPRIVVGVDGSPISMRALTWAADEAQRRGAVLEVVHVDFSRQEVLEALAEDMLEAEQLVLRRVVAQAEALAPGIRVVGQIYDPPAGQALIAASQGAEMLVVGTRGLSGLRELALGSVSTECARHARCPVVIIGPNVSPRKPTANAEVVTVSSAGPNKYPQ